jgi:calcineurin-like phosphoesterase family protein
MSTYFTSDTHFGHANIIKYCNRPFQTVDEMDTAMIERWNKVVHFGDKVYHLGDFCWKGSIEIIRYKLNGTIYLIEGNHDKLSEQQKRYFSWVRPYYELVLDKQRIVLFHYAMRVWHRCERGSWHLFGHSHGGLPQYGKSIDVGVDVWDFAPVSMDQLDAKFDDVEEFAVAFPMFNNFPEGQE